MSGIEHRNIAGARTVPYFSHVVLDGDYAFLAGMTAADSATASAALGDVAAETRAVMELLRATLAAVGLGFSDVVSARVHLVRPESFEEMNLAYASYFESGRLPARTCVGVTWLAGGALVEIDCIARRR